METTLITKDLTEANTSTPWRNQSLPAAVLPSLVAVRPRCHEKPPILNGQPPKYPPHSLPTELGEA